jgi:NitT/TauT family transport system substrate-binding protein
MKHRIFNAVPLIALGFSVLATAQQPEKIHLKAGLIPVPEHSKLIIARDKGFFAQDGLDVELIEFANSADGIAALRGGKIDAGSVGITAPLVHISKGAENIRLIGGLGGEGSAVVVRADLAAKINNLAGLKGLKVGTVRLSSSDVIVRSELSKAGIEWKTDIQIFELKSPAAVLEAVRSKEVDAGVVWAPFDTKAEEVGLKVLVRTGKLSPGHPCCRIAVLSEDLAKRPVVWVSYLKAILRAERYIEENRTDAIEIVTQALKIDRKLVDEVITNGHTEFSSDPNVTGTVLFWNSMKQSDFITSDLNINKYVDAAPFKTALGSLLKAQPEDAYWKAKSIQFSSRN